MMKRRDEDDRTAELRVFLDDHYQRVVGSVSLITGDRAAAEDAVQEAVVKAWHRRDEPLDRLAAWITVVASNEARSGRRRESSRQRTADRLRHEVSAPDLESASTDPASFDPELVDATLARALAGLPKRERQATVLFYVFDLSVSGTAQAMSVSDGTIKTLLSRARNHLAAELDDTTDSASSGGVA